MDKVIFFIFNRFQTNLSDGGALSGVDSEEVVFERHRGIALPTTNTTPTCAAHLNPNRGIEEIKMKTLTHPIGIRGISEIFTRSTAK